MKMAKKVKGYDVYFRLTSPSSVLVAANSEKEAVEEAYKVLDNMSKDELIDRLLDAYNFCGLKVVGVEYVDDLDEDEV